MKQQESLLNGESRIFYFDRNAYCKKLKDDKERIMTISNTLKQGKTEKNICQEDLVIAIASCRRIKQDERNVSLYDGTGAILPQ